MDTEKTNGIFFEFNEMWLNNDDEPLELVFFNPDCVVPKKNGDTFSRKGATIKREPFNKLKGEYYQLRGWEVERGLPTEEEFPEIDLDDIAAGLKAIDLLR